jgi:hypothetical protein
VAVGVSASLLYTLWLAPLVAAGAFIVCAYNLELFGGAFHSDTWFAAAWGSFPVLAAYLAAAERITVEALLAGVFAGFLSLAQRRLSTQVRTVRRRVAAVDGTIELLDGGRETVTPETLTAAPEAALRALTLAVIALATSILVLRLG